MSSLLRAQVRRRSTSGLISTRQTRWSVSSLAHTDQIYTDSDLHALQDDLAINKKKIGEVRDWLSEALPSPSTAPRSSQASRISRYRVRSTVVLSPLMETLRAMLTWWGLSCAAYRRLDGSGGRRQDVLHQGDRSRDGLRSGRVGRRV